MKKIEAIIRPFLLAEVRIALEALDVQEMTAFEVKIFPCQHSHKEQYRGMVYEVDFIPMIKLEIFIRDDKNVERHVDAISRAAAMDQAGGGRVDISDIETAA